MQGEIIFTVRYAETDQMAIVHHSNFAVWAEAGRNDLLKSIGASNKIIEENGALLPLYEMYFKFIFPAKFEDEILVSTKIKDISRVRISFSYEIKNAIDNKSIAVGKTMHAWTDKTLKPINAKKIIPDIYSILNMQQVNIIEVNE